MGGASSIHGLNEKSLENLVGKAKGKTLVT